MSVEWYCFEHDLVFESRDEWEKHMRSGPHNPWPLLYEFRGVRGVSLIEDEYGRRRYLPAIIVEAMKKAGRKIKVIAWGPTVAELIAKGYPTPWELRKL